MLLYSVEVRRCGVVLFDYLVLAPDFPSSARFAHKRYLLWLSTMDLDFPDLIEYWSTVYTGKDSTVASVSP